MNNQFAHQYPDGKFYNIFPSPILVAMCDDMQQLIVEIKITEQKGGGYYGWLETNNVEPTMIYPYLQALNMCFPYGIAIEEKEGSGRCVELSCEAIHKNL